MNEILFEDLQIGDIIEVTTYNSTYILESLGNRDFMVQGGKYYPKPKKEQVNGCTWGGSMIWTGGIRIGMHLEIKRGFNKRLVTSPIENIKKEKNQIKIMILGKQV